MPRRPGGAQAKQGSFEQPACRRFAAWVIGTQGKRGEGAGALGAQWAMGLSLQQRIQLRQVRSMVLDKMAEIQASRRSIQDKLLVGPSPSAFPRGAHPSINAQCLVRCRWLSAFLWKVSSNLEEIQECLSLSAVFFLVLTSRFLLLHFFGTCNSACVLEINPQYVLVEVIPAGGACPLELPFRKLQVCRMQDSWRSVEQVDECGQWRPSLLAAQLI